MAGALHAPIPPPDPPSRVDQESGRIAPADTDGLRLVRPAKPPSTAARIADRILWVYWEMPPGITELPPHISLCRQIMERKAVGYKLNVVTPDNVRYYLPDIPDRVFQIRLNPAGRWQRYFGRPARRAAAIALRADYIRAFLLERHGGIYIDSDAIVLGDLVPFFEELERVGFLVTRRSSFGKSHASVGFYGSIAGGPIIREYADALRARLEKTLDYSWNEIGAEMLTAVVDRHAHAVAIVSEAEVQPITFEEADEKFASTTLDLKDVLPDRAKIFMLYSGPFKKALAGLSREELYCSERLVSKAFRYACDNAPVPPA